MNHALQKIAKDLAGKSADVDRWSARAESILDGCNPVQRRFISDTSKYKSLRCPRRSGKSYAMTSQALYIGEKYPNSRILVISLTLKSTKENYWTGAPGGLFAQNHKYGLGLTFNHTDLVWFHENGSRGRLAGAETKADIEYFRGAAAESDIIIIDECKSFAPALLNELIRDVIKPGLMTRRGSLVMGGTPGNIPLGPFYEATSPSSTIKTFVNGEEIDIPTCIPYRGKRLPDTDGRWSLHSWTIADNEAKPWQWDEANIILSTDLGNNPEHPVWRREYLGEWVTDNTELVYSFAKMKGTGTVTWLPDRTKGNPCGLPKDEKWNLLMGLDFGYEDDCAIVLAAWSDTKQELRHVYDWRSPHITIDEFAEEIIKTIGKFGQPDVIVGDKGALGKMIVETLNARHGLGIIPAEKKDKYDHIEFLNSDFVSGKIKIIPDSDLDYQLCGLQWDLEKDKTLLIRTGKLREDPSCPNHLCDCLLYLWRYAYHHWSRPKSLEVEKGSVEWWITEEKRQLQEYRARLIRELSSDSLNAEFSRIKERDRRNAWTSMM